MEFPSKLIENGVSAFASLPGIGKKTALRLVIHLLQEDEEFSKNISESIFKLRTEIKYCQKCGNISDDEICSICNNPSRKHDIICVVENFRDILAIENTGQYRGVYHILGGLISPLDGIGPEKLNISSLIQRIQSQNIQEIIMALNPTIEGDTTLFYLSKQLSQYPVTLTTLARGVAFGGELEYVDEVTLARSIQSRRPFENYISGQNS
ncbi:MAG: recombination mediator RecR [Chitinophagales bacterium]|nr:recombination mediator RecR [Chitinophagales bacterium]